MSAEVPKVIIFGTKGNCEAVRLFLVVHGKLDPNVVVEVEKDFFRPLGQGEISVDANSFVFG